MICLFHRFWRVPAGFPQRPDRERGGNRAVELCCLQDAEHVRGDGGRLTMTLIDLGNAEPVTEVAAAPVNLPRLRRLALAVLTAVGLAAMTASTPPAPSLVRPLWTTALQPSDTVATEAEPFT